jgi:META domain/Membrane-bound lysozyme-inhibitor of c-type lysozyme
MSTRDSFLIFTSSIIVLSLVYTAILQVSKIQIDEIESTEVSVFTNTENVSVKISSSPEHNNISFSGIGYIDLPIAATTSASGVRYVNNEAAIEIWNKGSELTVFRAGDPVFFGVSGAISMTDNDSGDYEPIIFTEALTSYTWQWLQPGLDQTVIESFTLKHEKDGSVIVTTDCNTYTGTYAVTSDKKINYSLPVSTQRECIDMSNENTFIESLKQSQAANILETMELQFFISEAVPVMKFRIQLIPML